MTTENGWFQFDHGSCKPDIISPSMLGVILGKHEVPLAIHPRDEPVHKADRSWSTFGQLTAPFDDAARAKQAYGAAHWGTTVPLHSPPVSPPTRRISAELSAAAVRARPGRLSGLSVSHSKSVLYGAFVWARRALSSQKRRFPAPRAAACLIHYLLLQNVTSTWFTVLNGGPQPEIHRVDPEFVS